MDQLSVHKPGSWAEESDTAVAANGFTRLRRRIWMGVVALLVAIWGLFAYSSAQQLTLTRQAAFENTATLAKLMEAWALSTLGRIDDLSSSVEIYLGERRTPAELERLLRRHQLYDAGLFLTIDVAGPDDALIATSNGAPAAAAARNFDTDRDPNGNVLIGMPRLVAGRMLIPIRRVLHGANGEPVGSLVVEVDPSYFAGFYADLGLPMGAAAMLFRADGPLLARNRAALGELGRSYPDAALWPALRGEPSGGYDSIDLDGQRRLTSFRANGTIPFIVVIGFDTDVVFADTWNRVAMTGVISGVLSLALLAAAAAMLRQLRRRLDLARDLAMTAAAVGSVGSGVVILRQSGDDFMVEQFNPAFQRLTAHGTEDIQDWRWRSIAGAPAAELLHMAISGEEATGEMPFLRGDGRSFWAEVRIAPIRAAGFEDARFVAVVADISARKVAEMEIIHAKEAAEAASRAKSEFLANMSHELRTPLNAIIGFSDMMASQLLGPLSARYMEYAIDIRHSGEHLLAIITDILDLAKIEAHQVTLEEGVFAIEPVFDTCRTLVASRAQQGNVRIEIAPLAHLPLLFADELRVKQIVLNLLSNAVKFTPPGGTARLSARVARDGGIEIVVADTGCGMTEEEVALAVQPFRQVNSSIARQSEGTGLGLPIVHRLTEMHGGRLQVNSTPGQGTTVVAAFPPSRTRPESGVLRLSA